MVSKAEEQSMSAPSHHCTCGQKKRDAMRTGQQLGLDELMIVNPGAPGLETLFLGADGNLYRVQGLEQADPLQGLGQFFLGDDGTLYGVEGFDSSGSTDSVEGTAESLGELEYPELGRYFLGEDGMLYEVVPK
jgi:hypothetical protein